MRDLQRLRQQLRRIQPRQPAALTQMPLTVGIQAGTGLRQRHAMADGRQCILQAAARAHMHVHIPAGHQRHRAVPADVQQLRQVLPIRALEQQFHGDPQICRQSSCAATAVAATTGTAPGSHRIRQSCKMPLHILARQMIAALRRRTPAVGDQRAQARIAVAIGRQGDKLQATGKREFRPDDELQGCAPSHLLHRHVRPHHARHRTLIGDGQRAVAELLRPLHQLRGSRCAAQEGEVAEAVQLRIGGRRRAHPDSPCRNQRCGGWRSRNTHTAMPCTSVAW